MMQIYAEVAGLRRRLIVVLPFLTPTIASLWVGLVTPIPSGLARPLVESLHCDAVMADHDIDTIIDPPGRTDRLPGCGHPGAGTDRQGQAQTVWTDTTSTPPPSESLPSDPDWAGEIVYTRSGRHGHRVDRRPVERHRKH